MSRLAADDMARETATVTGHKRATKRTEKRGFIRPVVRSDAVYWATDIQDAFGVQPVTFADWKRQGLQPYSTPAGDLMIGAEVIEFLQKHRKKTLRQRNG